jgi:Ca-activated chloride channel family protein
MPAPAGGRESSAAHPQVAATRQIATVEVGRLRASAGLPDHERRELLADLASRLNALVGHLLTLGLPEATYAPLRDLVAAIGRGGDLGALWAQALRVLDGYAAPERRGAFWKR